MTTTMNMLPNDHHPGPRCSCAECQRRYPEVSAPAQPTSNELVARLRAVAGKGDIYDLHGELELAAADEIERLKRELYYVEDAYPDVVGEAKRRKAKADAQIERLQRELERIAGGESYPAGIARAALGFKASSGEPQPSASSATVAALITWLTAKAQYEQDEVEAEDREFRYGATAVAIERLRTQNSNLQAKIDALMLEFCPGEMSAEQRANWANSQQRAEFEPEAAPVAWQRVVDSAYELRPSMQFSDSKNRPMGDGWEPLYKRPAQPPETVR